ncbi:MAG TPA: dockerin type I domain-containing protein [Phycisphaerae bacterium]|nr:dockerin type I domain-containing protein [Phycisphaerae bacterium]
MRITIPIAFAFAALLVADRSHADIPIELAPDVWTDSPDATARVVGELDSPDGNPAAIEVIAPASAVIRFGDSLTDSPVSPRGGTPTDLPIGTEPEGDVPIDVEFHPSGASYFILHRLTRNIIRFDTTTHAPLQIYALSGQIPQAMDISPDGSLLVVVYYTEDQIGIVDVATGAESMIPTGDGPGTVDITPDGSRVLVGCVMDNTLRVISMTTLTEERSITTPTSTQTISFGLESGVVHLKFPGRIRFLDASRILFPGNFNSLVAVIDFTTGARTDIPTIANPTGVAVSDNGAVIAVSHAAANGVTTIIDPVTLTVNRTIDSPGGNTRANGPIVLNSTGTRAVIAFQNAARWLDLTTDTFGPALGTANLEDLLVNTAGTRVIGVGFSSAVIDFDTGALIGTPNNTVSCYHGAVSPTADRAVQTSWPTFGDDRVVLDTDSTPALLFFGRTAHTPEGDISRCAAVTPDGSTAVCSNLYSDNLSIFDADTGELLRYGALDSRPGEVEITPDNTRAVSVNLDGFTVSVVNLATGATTAIPSATRLAEVEIDASGAFAYVSQIASGDGVRKINLATNTFVGGITPTSDMGGVGYAYSQNSQIALSPDGSLLAVPGGFNDRFDIINTSTMAAAQTFTPLGTFITRASWSPEGDEILISDRDADAVTVLRRPSPTDPFADAGTIPVGNQPFDTLALPASDRAFVINFGTPRSIGVLDTTALTQSSTIPLPNMPVGMSLSADGSTLSVLSVAETTTVGGGDFIRVVDGEITVIDTATLAVLDTIDTNQTASMLAADATGEVLACPGMSSEVLTLVNSVPIAGDINDDGQIDELDVAIFVAVLLGDDTNPAHVAASNLNQDGAANGADIQLFVAAFLGD